jgi:hypothetical protein
MCGRRQAADGEHAHRVWSLFGIRVEQGWSSSKAEPASQVSDSLE